MCLLALVRSRTGSSCAVLRWTARTMYLLARGRTRTGVRMGNVPTCPCSYSYWYLLCSASLGQHGQRTKLPVVVLVLVPLVQCFAWTTRAMYLCARACILVQCLCSASHGQCTYLPVVVLVLVSARVMYLLARSRTRTGTCCVVLRLGRTGYVPMCPCLYPCTVFVQCFARAMYPLAVVVLVLVSARVMNLLARGRTRTGTSCAVLRLDSTGYVPMCPCLYPCTVVRYG